MTTDTTNKNGATARTVSPTQQQPGRPAKQNHSTLLPPASQAITGFAPPPAVPPHLPPPEQRCLEALNSYPEGIKSYNLRELTYCSYVPEVIRRLVLKGYQISCTMLPDGFTIDGRPTKIGWYRLVGFLGVVTP